MSENEPGAANMVEEIGDAAAKADEGKAEMVDTQSACVSTETYDPAADAIWNSFRAYAHTDEPEENELIKRSHYCYQRILDHLAYAATSHKTLWMTEDAIHRAIDLVPAFEGFVKSIIDYRYAGRDEVMVIDASTFVVGLEEKIRKLREISENSPDANFLRIIEQLARIFEEQAEDLDRGARFAQQENDKHLANDPFDPRLPRPFVEVDRRFKLSGAAFRASSRLTKLAQKFALAGRKVKVIREIVRGDQKIRKNKRARLKLVSGFKSEDNDAA